MCGGNSILVIHFAICGEISVETWPIPTGEHSARAGFHWCCDSCTRNSKGSNSINNTLHLSIDIYLFNRKGANMAPMCSLSGYKLRCDTECTFANLCTDTESATGKLSVTLGLSSVTCACFYLCDCINCRPDRARCIL